MAEENDTNIAEQAGGKSKKKLFIIIGVVVLLLAIGGGAAVFLLGGSEPEGEEGDAAEVEETAAPPQYFAIEPALVVNFEDSRRVRFLQLKVEVMARDNAAIEAVQLHLPVIRNNLNLLYSQQDPAVIATREGKETLQQQTLTEIQKILDEQGAEANIEQVYFTSFVMQ
jgi:flagellar FliL protein